MDGWFDSAVWHHLLAIIHSPLTLSLILLVDWIYSKVTNVWVKQRRVQGMCDSKLTLLSGTHPWSSLLLRCRHSSFYLTGAPPWLETVEVRRWSSLALTPPASLSSHGSRPRPACHTLLKCVSWINSRPSHERLSRILIRNKYRLGLQNSIPCVMT